LTPNIFQGMSGERPKRVIKLTEKARESAEEDVAGWFSFFFFSFFRLL